MYKAFEKPQVFTIPNLLSLFRIILIPFVIGVYIKGHYVGAGVLLIISALSDTADGFIARRYNQITTLGKVLDPVADKLTQFCVAFCLCFSYNALIPLAIVLFVKEFMMGILGVQLLRRGLEPFGARWWGKVATTVFYVGVIILMLFGNRMATGWVWAISLLVILMLVYSMWRYIVMYQTILRRKRLA